MASTNSEKIIFPKSLTLVYNETQFNSDNQNYKYIPVERVISSYNAKYKGFPIDSYDAIEWIYETIKEIGSIDEYVPQEREVSAENFLAKIPCGVYKLISVTVPGCAKCPVKYVDNGTYLQLFENRPSVSIAYYGIPEDENGMPMVLEEYLPACVLGLFINNKARADWYTGIIDNTRWKMLNDEYGVKCGDARGTFRYFSRNNSEDYTRFVQKMVSTYKDNRNLKF